MAVPEVLTLGTTTGPGDPVHTALYSCTCQSLDMDIGSGQ